MGFSNPMVTYILEQFAVTGHTISPRIALIAAELVEESGIDSLNYIADFNSNKDVLTSAISKFNSIVIIQKKIKIMVDLVSDFKVANLSTIEGIKEGTRINKRLFSEIASLKSTKADDSVVGMSTSAIKEYTTIYNSQKMIIESILEDSVSTSTIDLKSAVKVNVNEEGYIIKESCPEEEVEP